jgi:predicted CopG family antitoxin
MTKTVKISDEYHSWIKSHKREGETMEETIRRLTGGPDPKDVAGILTPEEAESMKAAVKRRRDSDNARKRQARETFSSDDS